MHENHYNDFPACYHNTHFSTSFTGAKNIHNAAPVDSTGYYIFELADIFFFQILFCKLPSDFNRLPHVPFTQQITPKRPGCRRKGRLALTRG